MSQFKASFFNAQTIVLVISLLLGALYLFWDKFKTPEPEARSPVAEVGHQVFSACLDESYRWVRALVEVRNIGSDALSLSEGEHFVQELLPASDALLNTLATGTGDGSIDWSRFAERRQIQRAEGDGNSRGKSPPISIRSNEVYRDYLDVVVSPDTEVVQITSFFEDRESGESGPLWQGSAKTLYAVRENIGCAE